MVFFLLLFIYLLFSILPHIPNFVNQIFLSLCLRRPGGKEGRWEAEKIGRWEKEVSWYDTAWLHGCMNA
jgi:hypothetical protein